LEPVPEEVVEVLVEIEVLVDVEVMVELPET
jgi:hypothetical protein